MFHEKIPKRQMMAWLLVAMTAPLSIIAGKDGWLPALTAAAVCTGLCLLAGLLPTRFLLRRKWFCLIQIVWIVVVLGEMLRWSCNIWPTAGTNRIVPLALLTLAALSSLHGSGSASRTGSVLLWFIAILYILVLLAGFHNIRADYLIPEWNMPAVETITALLLPTVVAFLPEERGKGRLWIYPAIGVFFVILAVFTVGTLSFDVSAGAEWPLYQSGKSLSLFGVAERFEAFLSVAATIAFFAIYSLLLTALGHLSQHMTGKGRVGVVCGAAASGAWLLLPGLPPVILPLGILLFWFLLPGFFRLIYVKNDTKRARK